MARAKKSKYDYIIGQRFGYIEPLEYIGRGKFRCLCHNCGNTEYINTSQHILAGECKSCGCLPRYKDITGTIINGFYITTATSTIPIPPLILYISKRFNN